MEEKAQLYEKDYTSSRDKKESAIKEYKKAVENISGWYKEAAEKKLDKIKDYQKEEHEGINEKSAAISKEKKMLASKEYKKYLQDKQNLKDEIALAIEEDDNERAAIKSQELKELTRRNPIIQCKKEIKEADNKIQFARNKIDATKEYLKALEDSKNKCLDKAIEDRDNAFSGLVKQNFWQKVVGSIFNKFYRAGKVTNSVLEKLEKLEAKVKEDNKKIIEEYDRQQEKNAQAKAEREKKRAQAKAERAEEIRKHIDEIKRSFEERIAETDKQLEAARARYNGKNMTPALAGGNIVPFERD